MANRPCLEKYPRYSRCLARGVTVGPTDRHLDKCKAMTHMTATDFCPDTEGDLLDTIAVEHINRSQR